MTRHKKMKKVEKINVDASCITLIVKRIPSKLKDSGSFTIPIEIGDRNFNKALCNLRVNINLIPLTTYWKLELGDLKNTLITL